MTCGVETCTEPARGKGDPMCELHASMASAIAQNRRGDARRTANALRERGLPLPRGWE